MAKLFGTDGVRGIANQELTPQLALQLGRAGAYVLAGAQKNPCMVVGKDTRISGDMLEAALAAGICSAGVDVYLAGYLPTPAVAILTKQLKATGGIVISASHNPVQDNGIKFFGADGYKLLDDTEEQIEALIHAKTDKIPSPVGAQVGRIYRLPDAEDRYVQFLKGTVDVDFTGLKVVVDCAHGAAYRVAPRVLRELGATVETIFDQPDGVNINAGCGSTYPQKLQEVVVAKGADLGLAHDGDADRLIAVDHRGQIVDGDQMMVILANHLKSKGGLALNTVVVTVMSNLGLHLALGENDIQVRQTQVGDRYVLEELLNSGAAFGGEQSGHVLFLEHSPTGDGVLTALQLLAAVQNTGRTLADLAAQMERLPQLLVNIPVANKHQVMTSAKLADAVAAKEKELAGQGRILVRPSGTESLVRVMAEGRRPEQIETIVNQLAELVQKL